MLEYKRTNRKTNNGIFGKNKIVDFINRIIDFAKTNPTIASLFVSIFIAFVRFLYYSKTIFENLIYFYNQFFRQTLNAEYNITSQSIDLPKMVLTITKNTPYEVTFLKRDVRVYLCYHYRNVFTRQNTKDSLVPNLLNQINWEQMGSTQVITYQFTEELRNAIRDSIEDQKILKPYLLINIQQDDTSKPPKIIEINLRKFNPRLTLIGIDKIAFERNSEFQLSEGQKQAIINSQERDKDED